MIPKFKYRLIIKPPTKESIKPLNQEYFRVNILLSQQLISRKISLLQQNIKGPTINRGIILLERE